MTYGGSAYGGSPYGGGGGSLAQFLQTLLAANQQAANLQAQANAVQPWVALAGTRSAIADLAKVVAAYQAPSAAAIAAALGYQETARQASDTLLSIIRTASTPVALPAQGALREAFLAVVELSKAPLTDQQAHELRGVATTLQSAEAEDIEPEAVAEQIQNTVPGLAELVAELRQARRGWPAHVVVAILVNVILVFLTAWSIIQQSGNLTAQQEEQLLQRFEQSMSSLPAAPPPDTPHQQGA